MNNMAINKINEFLLKKWDPIGIGKTPGFEDEYFHYADEIYNIISRSNSYKELFEYLWWLETEHMLLDGNRTKTEKFAQILFNEVKNMQ